MNTVDALSFVGSRKETCTIRSLLHGSGARLAQREHFALVSQETLDAIGAAVGDLATQFSGAGSEDQVKFYELDFRLKAVEAQIRNFSSKGSDEKLMPITARRAFSSIPKYGGSSKEYDSWKFQMTQFLAEDMDFPSLLV